MATFLTILFVLNALLLIGVVLIQQPKTSAGLFSGTGQSLLGTSGKTFWTKFTTVLAVVFMAICVLLSILPGRSSDQSSVADQIEKQQQQQQAAAQQAQQAQAGAAVAPKVPEAKSQANPAPQAVPGVPNQTKK